jgi:hypothetical protein
MKFSWNAHKSTKSVPRPTTPLNPISQVDVTIVATGEEVYETMLGFDGDIILPQPVGNSGDSAGGDVLLKYLIEAPQVTFNFTYSATQLGQQTIQSQSFPSATFYAETGGVKQNYFYVVTASPDRSRLICRSVANMGDKRDDFIRVGHVLLPRIYCFRAERLNITEFAFGPNSVLAPDASNLPEVLHYLLTNKPLQFEKFVGLVKEIFTGVEYLSIRAKGPGTNLQEIVLWTEPGAHGRSDLAFTLKESGTGLGQVLAILYVVLNTDQPQCILIDEPNSFLHPAASRKLIRILGEFRQHQYIISTHSPEVISAAKPTNIVLLQRESEKTTVSILDATQLESQEKYMQAVGVKLSDVYGSDNIIWVEGITEEALFPALISMNDLTHPHDITTILAVKHTGDFQGKKSKRLRLILDLYRRLSTSGALIPPSLGFVFDSEGLTNEEKLSLVSESRNLIHFLPRRMIENYFLVPDILAEVFGTLDTFKETSIKADEIKDWLAENGAEGKYFSPLSAQSDVFSEMWLKTVNGAALLDELLATKTKQLERYDKLKHGLAIGRKLIDVGNTNLDEIRYLLRSIITQSRTRH